MPHAAGHRACRLCSCLHRDVLCKPLSASWVVPPCAVPTPLHCKQVIIQKLNPTRVAKAEGPEAQKAALKQCSDQMLQYSDAMMAAFLAVFRCRSATVHEEALLAVGALVDASGPAFLKYMVRHVA